MVKVRPEKTEARSGWFIPPALLGKKGEVKGSEYRHATYGGENVTTGSRGFSTVNRSYIGEDSWENLLFSLLVSPSSLRIGRVPEPFYATGGKKKGLVKEGKSLRRTVARVLGLWGSLVTKNAKLLRLGKKQGVCLLKGTKSGRQSTSGPGVM